MGRTWRRLVQLGRLAAAVSLLAACRGTPVEDENTFRSEANHLQVTLPPGWAASEGPERLARPFVGLVAFDSWGKAGFWAPQVTTETTSGVSARYSPQDVLGQIPHGGAYVVLIHYEGGPRIAADSYGPEHEQQDLGGLWERTDCREGDIAPGVTWVDFYKWGRLLRLEVYCAPDSSDETAAAVNDPLMSWRFDRVPAGDAGWATIATRQLLPPAVEPAKFPIPTAGPFQSLAQEDDIVRITQAEVRNGTVVIRFAYRWNEPARGSDADDCPEDRCHWWRFEARPNGEIVLVEEGGATLTSPTETTAPTVHDDPIVTWQTLPEAESIGRWDTNPFWTYPVAWSPDGRFLVTERGVPGPWQYGLFVLEPPTRAPGVAAIDCR